MVYSTAFLKDTDFLKRLDEERSQVHFIKIEVLDMEERPLSSIEGRCLQGSSINFDGSSSMRATCNINFVAEEGDNDLTNIDNILSINKRIAVYEGIENYIDDRYPDVCWFKQGVFVINQITISHSLSSVQFSLSCKDKMCLLNGECGGGLPASITFDSYDQINEDGSVSTYKQYIFDIIFSIVHRYGNVPMDKIFIADIEKDIKQSVRFVGTGNLYFNTTTGEYRTSATDDMLANSVWVTFEYNDDVGYEYTGFTYPGELVSAIGDNVCSILDKIKTLLGNYEYYFDKDGNFHFQQIRNYLNNSYYPVKDTGETVLPTFKDKTPLEVNNNVNPQYDDQGKRIVNDLCVINEKNYLLDIRSNTKVAYEFINGELLTNLSATPNYANIKNDYHIWGATDKGQAIHYHLAIKKKPEEFGVYIVEPIKDSTRVKVIDKIGTVDPSQALADYNRYDIKDIEDSTDKMLSLYRDAEMDSEEAEQVNLTLHSEEHADSGLTISGETLNLNHLSTGELYIPTDWRAELYLNGMYKQLHDIRPDIFEQELLDLFDNIYDFQAKEFKTDIVHSPNTLLYFFDYLEPVNKLYDYSIDTIGLKTMSIQEDKIKRMYNTDIPDYIILSFDNPDRDAWKQRCTDEGQQYTNVTSDVAKNLSIGTIGYTAEEVARTQIYQYTNYNETIQIQAIPIYHLEPNTRITVRDSYTGIDGDYVIRSISLPLGGKGTMSISAGKALERI